MRDHIYSNSSVGFGWLDLFYGKPNTFFLAKKKKEKKKKKETSVFVSVLTL